MKKLFSHSNKKAQDWEDYDESEYDWDSVDEDLVEDDIDEDEYPYGDEDAYYEEETYAEGTDARMSGDAYYEEEMYADETDAQIPEDAYYEEEAYEDEADVQISEDSAFMEESEGVEGDYYMSEEEPVEPEEYEAVEDASYYEEYGQADDDYGDDLYFEDAEGAAYPEPPAKAKKAPGKKEGFFAKVGSFLHSMDTMDRVMVAAGAGVLILAILTGSVFIRAGITDRQVSDFAEVGTQLDGISMIGEQGLMAVADAQRAKLEASVIEPEEPEEEPKKDYEESGYERQVAVQPNFTSIQKDLKIKFINKKTEKLVANVPFSVTITDPNGKSSIWSDDDMDGIIYKKDITPGTYKVAMESLTDAKYADYVLATDAQSVEVKKDIDYKKVDVADEVKQESEVNAKKEDTKKNEVAVESSLQDTVAWVESKVISADYTPIDKKTIPDPMTLAMNLTVGKQFMRMGNSETTSVDQTTTTTPEVPPTPTPTPEQTPEPTPTSTPEPTTTPASTPEPTPEPTQSPTPTPTPTPLAVTVAPGSLSGVVGESMVAKAAASGGADSAYSYSASSSNSAVATASASGDGTISVTGVAKGDATITVTAKNGSQTATASIGVSVRDKAALSLDKTSMTLFTQTSAGITAKLGDKTQFNVSAASSDAGKATVSANGNTVTVTGVAEGSATITVSCKEGNETLSATCAVTVKLHPKEDKKTLLKDANGRQVYVKEGDKYREAVRADYYTATAFYLKGEGLYTGWQTIDGKVYYFTAESKKVTGEQVIQGAKYNFASDGSLVVGSGTSGIDVSKWNGNIDWNAVKNSGISYVIIRSGYRGSSEGKLIVDPKFEANIKGASAAGLKVGIYFFSQAVDEIEAVEEASMVLGQIKNYKISYPVFLDVETSGGRGDKIDKATRTAVCKAFCQTIQNAGYTAGVYSNKNWLENKLDPGSLSAYKIWLAQYAASPTYKGRYDLWQYRSTGNVSGIKGNVDMNISYLGY